MHKRDDTVAVMDAHGLCRFVGTVISVEEYENEVYYRVLYPGDQYGQLFPDWMVKTVEEARREYTGLIRRYSEVAKSVS